MSRQLSACECDKPDPTCLSCVVVKSEDQPVLVIDISALHKLVVWPDGSLATLSRDERGEWNFNEPRPADENPRWEQSA